MAIVRDLLIGGKMVPASGGRVARDVDPYTGDVVAEVAAAAPSDAVMAVDAAAAAFDAWSSTPPKERRRVLLKAADVLESKMAEVAGLMTAETGSIGPWGFFNVDFAANMLREAAAAATAPIGEVLATDAPDRASFAIRQPAGVVVAFAPWNAPVILGVRAIAVPLAVGNTVVLKPSEESPLTAGLFLADVLSEAGLPDGVLNVVTNDPADASSIAEALISDARVRRVSFTGSTKVGRLIGEIAARHLTPAILELGGKNSVVVLEDADVGYAVDAVAFGTYMHAGQICMSADRVIVHESLSDEFTERLAAKASVLPTGDPRSEGTLIGPLISERAAARVESLVEEAVAGGASLRAGGGKANGALYPPSVLADVSRELPIWHEEIFGPVCTVHTFADDAEAIAAANDTSYGLTAGIITDDAGHGFEVASRIRTGIAHINDQSVDDEPQAPFGGVGDSGYGRFGGRAGIDSFTELRWITLQHGRRHFPF
jgi:acyl-CoA reductase-like NAD-dependent aldehyde dehydrogenase